MKEKITRNNNIIVFILCFAIVAFIIITVANVLLEMQVSTAGGVPEASNGILFESLTGTGSVKIEGSITSRKIASSLCRKEVNMSDSAEQIMNVTVYGNNKSGLIQIYKDSATGTLYSLCPDGSVRSVDQSSLKKLMDNEQTKTLFAIDNPETLTVNGISISPSSYKIEAETLFDTISLSKEKEENIENISVLISEKGLPEFTGINEDASVIISKDNEQLYKGTYKDYLSGNFQPDNNGEYAFSLTVTKEYGYITYDFIVDFEYMPEFSLTSTSQNQGGLFILTISNTKGNDLSAYASFDYEAVFTAKDNSAWCYIPVGESVSEGQYSITATCGEYSADWTVTINSSNFGIQYVDDSLTELDEATWDVAAAEYDAVMKEAYSSFDSTTYWQGTFGQPIEGTVSIDYGTNLYLNGSDSPVRHSGIDLTASKGDEVMAPAAGKVLYVGETESTGKMVIIEHGNGLHSYFFHLSETNCKKGDVVSQGDIIGLAGSSGYTSSTVLHYQLMIGRFAINPDDAFNGTSVFYKIYELGLTD